MFGKTPITALQEYCAKKSLPFPNYELRGATDGSKSFVCIVRAVNEMAEGVGRSKREAKHDAAANIIKKLKLTCPDIEDIPQAHFETIPTSDAVADLRDLCLRDNHPFPSFDLVQHAGPPEAPEFTIECRVASIVQYATASTKKAARQLAAQELIKIIRQASAADTSMEIASVDQMAKEIEEMNRKKIKTYREYTESDIKSPPGTCITDRHKFFKNLEIEKRTKVYYIFRDENIHSSKDKVDLALKALEIPYKIEEIPGKSLGSMFAIQLYCDLDVLFVGLKDSIFDEMILYLQDMLR